MIKQARMPETQNFLPSEDKKQTKAKQRLSKRGLMSTAQSDLTGCRFVLKSTFAPFQDKDRTAAKERVQRLTKEGLNQLLDFLDLPTKGTKVGEPRHAIPHDACGSEGVLHFDAFKPL